MGLGHFHDAVEEVCDIAGLPAASLRGPFADTGQAPKYFRLNIIDRHPNAEYCSLVAESVFDALEKRGYLTALQEGAR